MPLRIVFMGTAQLACPCLAALHLQPEFHICSVATQPDRPRGRELKLFPSPIKELALNSNLPLLQPLRAREEAFFSQLQDLQPDLIVVVAYGQILPQTILSLPRLGCINLHTSLLPKYRGAAPIQWALLNNEPLTGVTLIQMDAGMDSGDILAHTSTPIHPDDDAQSLHDRLGTLGAALLISTIPRLPEITPQAQDPSQVTYAPKITKEDGQIDWNQPARSVLNRIRAFTPWPGAFTRLPSPSKPQLLKIWKAAVLDQPSGKPGQILAADKTGIVIGCGSHSLQILSLQLEGRRRLSPIEFLSGHPLSPGQQFSSG